MFAIEKLFWKFIMTIITIEIQIEIQFACNRIFCDFKHWQKFIN